MNFPREGIVAALATPTLRSGRLRRAALSSNLGWLRRRGVHGVLALGSTGEFPRFTLDERIEILDAVIGDAGTLPVAANVSDIRADVAIELGKFAAARGAGAVALMPPPFFPLSDADQRDFFLKVARSVPLPLILYNFPERTGNRIALETIAAVAKKADLLGIKQSGAEFAYHRELVALGRKQKFVVYSGADTRLPEAFAVGASGCIGGLVNFLPEPMLALFAGRESRPTPELKEAAQRLVVAGNSIDRITFPLNVAAGMEARGLDPGWPKTVVSEETQEIYAQVVADLKRDFHAWQLDAPRADADAAA